MKGTISPNLRRILDDEKGSEQLNVFMQSGQKAGEIELSTGEKFTITTEKPKYEVDERTT
jgi:hypothetical protein